MPIYKQVPGASSDPDIVRDFQAGAYGDCSNVHPVTTRKSPAETEQERFHHGSTTWIEAPTLLSDFMLGSSNSKDPQFDLEMGADGPRRANRAAIR